MENSLYTWYKLAESRSSLVFGPNDIAEAEVNGRQICVGKFQDKLFAFAHKCPHAGVLLSTGYLDMQGNVVCPLHQYKFSIRTGRNVTGEGYFMRRWEVQERSEGIFVAMLPGV